MTDPDNLIEAVAKKLWLDAANFEGKEAFWDTMARFDRESYFSAAKAAILATLEAVREPTPEMIEAAKTVWKAPGCETVARLIYPAMLTTLLASMKDGTHG